MAYVRWPELDTPCLRVDLERLERNLREMAAAARERGVQMRPHIKTHKMAEIARRQLELGAIGLTVAKLSEAEALTAAGFDDFFVCYPLLGTLKLRRLLELSRRVRVMTIVESFEGVGQLAATMAGEATPLDVLIKIDTGMHRVGVPPERAHDIAWLVATQQGLRLRGVCIHEGLSYGEPDAEKRAALAAEHAARAVEVANDLRRRGHNIEIVSTGSTPGARGTLQVEGVTEIRPGNYAFYDGTQVSLGTTDWDHCAISVVATVVSHSAPDRAVIDAGSKALTVDRGAHGTSTLTGYGTIRGRPGIVIERLSEEHGWLKLQDGETLQLGEQLDIIPNHACPVANNFPTATITRAGQVIDRWNVIARGCMT
jgi:D-serine deaminase-like pyridoxal phosphate-dependent protein